MSTIMKRRAQWRRAAPPYMYESSSNAHINTTTSRQWPNTATTAVTFCTTI